MENTEKTVSKKFSEAVKKHPGIIKITYPNGRISYRAKIAPSLQFAKTINKDLVAYRQKLGEAVEWREKTLRALRDGTYEHPKEKAARLAKEAEEKAASALSFDDFFTTEMGRRANTSAHETMRKNWSNYRAHLENQWGGVELSAITPERVEAWLAGLDPAEYPRLKNPIQLFRSVMRAAHARGLIETDPAAKIVFKPARDQAVTSRRHEPHALTYEQLYRLAQAAEPEYYTAILFAGLTGVRAGELVELKTSDIDLGKGLISVERAARGEGVHQTRGKPKTRKSIRQIPIAGELAGALAEQISQVEGLPGQWLFPAPDGAQWSSNRFSRVVIRASKNAGLPHTSGHDLRHTAASLFLNHYRLSPVEAQDLMGHDSSAILQRYSHSHLDSVASKLAMHTPGNIIAFDRSAS